MTNTTQQLLAENWEDFSKYRKSRIKDYEEDKKTKELNNELSKWICKVPEFFTKVKRKFFVWEWEKTVIRSPLEIAPEEREIKLRLNLIEAQLRLHKESFNIPNKTIESFLDWLAEKNDN